MALVAPPISAHNRHRQLPLCRPYNKAVTTTRASSSLSVSSEAHHSHRDSVTFNLPVTLDHHQSSFSKEIINKLLQSRNLNEVFLLLQRDSNNGTISFQKRVDGIGALLQACGQRKDIEVGRRVHEMVWAMTQFRNHFVLSTCLIKCTPCVGSPWILASFFYRLRERNLFQWNALISGYTRNDALVVFYELLSVIGLRPDNFTFPCVLKACVGLMCLGLGKSVHGMAVKMEMSSDVFVGNALISMYGRCRFLEDAVKVFENMPMRTS